MAIALIIGFLAYNKLAGLTDEYEVAKEYNVANDYETTEVSEVVNDETVVEENNSPEVFELSEDLQGAITILVQDYDNFGPSDVNDSGWQEYFISHFLTNSRYSFAYMNDVAEKNGGLINEEEAEYMNYSLTGQKVDFSLAYDIDTSDTSIFINERTVSSYTYDKTETGILVHAIIDQEHVTYDADGDMIIASDSYQMDVNLVKNPDSCFDGYSIESMKWVLDSE